MSPRLHTRWPLIVAGVFCVYSVLLLWNAFHAKEQLRAAAEARLVADSKRRAAALGEFVAQRRDATLELAGLHELRTYLVNKALGMSPQYGLDASLAAVEQRFDTGVHGVRGAEAGGYARIAFLDPDGQVLADTGRDAAAPPPPADPRGPTSLRLDIERHAIVATAPVLFKGEYCGTVVTLTDLGQLTRSLVRGVARGAYRETLLTPAGQDLTVAAHAHDPDPERAVEMARLPPDQPTALRANQRPARDADDTIALATPVPGLDAVLVTMLPYDEIYGHLSSSLFLYSLCVVPFAVLLAAFRIDRLQGRARTLELEAARADAQRNVLQGRNEALSDEIRRREAMEAELQRHRDHLEELVNRRTAELNRLFHALPDLYFRMARDGTILEHRAGRDADLFAPPESFLGKKMQDIMPPEVADKLIAALAEVERGADQCVTEYELLLPRGLQCFEARLLPLEQDQLLAVVRNVTERRRLEEVREANRREAERLARVKSEFLANMSHEIRTPLNAVLGLAHLGAAEADKAGAPDRFEGIVDAGRHLLSIVDDILDFSKLEAGKLTVEKRHFRLAPTVQAAVELVAGRTAAKALTLSVDLEPGLPEWVEGDALRLKQVLVNLLGNAVKFTDQGQVRLSVSAHDGWVSFDVADTGVGMDAELVRRLFQPFEQADGSTTRRFGGTGLGLAISHNLAGLMGGHITVESRPGQGSVFSLKLPLPAVAAPVAEPPRVAAAASGPRLQGYRLLAAEDNEVNRLILRAQLENEGCEVEFARNGQEAVAAVTRAGAAGFDAVLMDVQMPLMDGIEATRRVGEQAPGLPVIGLTAHALPEERERCLAAGMVDHISKPVDVGRLVACLLRHAARRPPPNPQAQMTTPA